MTGISVEDQLNKLHACVCVCVCVSVCVCSVISLCSSINCSPPGSSVHESLQARTLEWVASLLQKILSKGSSQSRDRTHISQVSALAGSILYHRAIWESQTSLRGSKSNRFFFVPVVLPSRDHWKEVVYCTLVYKYTI